MGEQPREVELKLEVSPADLGRLRRHPRIRELALGRASTRALRSVYFDTPALDLARRGIGLRLRWADGDSEAVQAVKARVSEAHSRGVAGLFERAEVECRVAGNRPDLDALPDAAMRRRLRRILAGKRLGPAFETRMRRTRRRLRHGRHEWTLDLDVGEVRGAGGRAPFCEIELELRRGDPGRLYDFALCLAKTIALRPATESKADRGYALVRAASPRPKRARLSSPSRGARVGEVLEQMLERCGGALARNAESVLDGEDPDGAKRMRAGALELCACLEIFREGLPETRARRLRREARWLAAALGAIGEIDCFAETFPERVLRAGGRRRDLARLRRALSALRAERVALLRDGATALRFGRLALELARLQLSGAAVQALGGARLALLSTRAASFAPGALARCHREVLQTCAAHTADSARGRRAQRDALETLRCACALFQDPYSKAAAHRYAAAVSRLSRAVEHLDAAAASADLALDIGDRIAPRVSPDTLRAVERVASDAVRRAERRVGVSRQAFRAERPFWRTR